MSTSLLEERYRLALRVLPASYRAAWADDMVDTFLERAHAAAPDDPEGVDNSRPGWGELASIGWLAIRLRLGGADAPDRPRLLGDAVRLAALLGLLYHAGLALAGLLITGWLSLGLPGSDIPPDVAPYPSRWQVITGWLGLLWVIALLTVLFGQYRYVWAPALIALVVDLAIIGVAVGAGPISATTLAMLAISLATVLALLAFHPSAPRVRPRPWLIALGVAPIAPAVTVLAVWPTGGGLLVLTDWLTPCCVAFVAVAIVQLRRASSTAWPLALALVAVALLVGRAASAVDLINIASSSVAWPLEVAVLTVQLVAVSAVGLVAATRAARLWQALPATTATTTRPDPRNRP
jgi:hypothetical protein